MDYEFDLFISYASEDRSWAERLYNDIQQLDTRIRCFWDRESLNTGKPWGPELQTKLAGSRHFVVLWSNAAEKEGGWVGPEIEKVQVQKEVRPAEERLLIYVPLQGKRGPLELVQGLPDIREGGLYKIDDNDPDRAAKKTKQEQAWSRIVNRIVNDINDAGQQGRTIPVALLVANREQFDAIDPRAKAFGKTLQAHLEEAELSLDKVRERYKDTYRKWEPFGTGLSIEDLLERIRTAVNGLIKPPGIRWKWIDLTEATKPPTPLAR